MDPVARTALSDGKPTVTQTEEYLQGAYNVREQLRRGSKE